jgi:hypothetical protein
MDGGTFHAPEPPPEPPPKLIDSSGAGASAASRSVGVEDAATDEEKAQIQKAHDDAVKMIDQSIARLEAAKGTPDPLVAEYFGIKSNSPEDQKKLDKLINNFNKMKKGMDTINYEVEHEDIKPGEPNTVAYVYRPPGMNGIGDVHVCYPMFDKVGEEERASTLVHEMSHYAARTGDHAYDHEKEKWDKMDQDDKMDNADSYGGFAKKAGH